MGPSMNVYGATRSLTAWAFQLLAQMLKPSLRSGNPTMIRPWRIVRDPVIVTAFQFGNPITIFVQMKINDLSRNPRRFGWCRLHKVRLVPSQNFCG